MTGHRRPHRAARARRVARTLLSVLVLALVAACSVTVGGSGTRSGSAPVPTSSASSPAAVPPAIPQNLRRTPVSTKFGDPDQLDWCAAMPGAVGGYGALEPEQVMSAGTCYLTLQSSNNAQQLEVTVEAVPISQVTRTVGTAARKVLVSGVPMYILGTEKSGDCSYFLAYGGLGIAIDELQNEAPAAVCPVERAVATTLADRFVHGPRIPTFAAPPWSLATANLCRAALASEAVATPPLQHVTVDERLLGSGCLLLSDRSEVYVTAGRATVGYTYPSLQKKVVDGRTMYLDRSDASSNCDVYVPQGTVSGTDEVLHVFLAPVGTDSTDYCAVGEKFAGTLLHGLGR